MQVSSHVASRQTVIRMCRGSKVLQKAWIYKHREQGLCSSNIDSIWLWDLFWSATLQSGWKTRVITAEISCLQVSRKSGLLCFTRIFCEAVVILVRGNHHFIHLSMIIEFTSGQTCFTCSPTSFLVFLI